MTRAALTATTVIAVAAALGAAAVFLVLVFQPDDTLIGI